MTFALIDDDGQIVMTTDDPGEAERAAEDSGYRLRW